jgi:hypothetical protein
VGATAAVTACGAISTSPAISFWSLAMMFDAWILSGQASVCR